MPPESVFHAGEKSVQSRLGVLEIEDWAKNVVRPFLPEQHRAFYADQPFLVAAARDEEGRPWATLLVGDEGFVSSPDPGRLRIAAAPIEGDALADAWARGTDVGLLGIELATRRRNRVNGRLFESDPALVLGVDQSFGNCPQYIQPREWERIDPGPPQPALHGKHLSPSQTSWIETSDTLFIASGHRGSGDHAHFGMDASHRGGAPGFVAVEENHTLILPDYAGNKHFNTIGNLVVDARVGLLFVDFETGSLLQISGEAEIVWEGPELRTHPGAQRLIRIRVSAVIELRSAIPLRWRTPEEGLRELALIEKRAESEDVTSFTFRDANGGLLPEFEPGQHLPIALELPDSTDTIERTYSLSNTPGAPAYRITVKRDSKGKASRFLHDSLEVGSVIRAGAPAGDFVLDRQQESIVLVSAGIGLTPLLSMLQTIAREAASGEQVPEVAWVHGARDGAHHPLREEARSAGACLTHFQSHIAYSQPRETDRPGRDYDVAGRIDRAALKGYAGSPNTQFYLCGPTAFMATMRRELDGLGVDASRVHTESFGPSA